MSLFAPVLAIGAVFGFLSDACSVVFSSAGVALEPGVQSWQNKQRQQCRGEQSTNDNGGERALHFRSQAGRKRHRQKSDAGNRPGHQNRTQPLLRALQRGLLHVFTLFTQTIDKCHQYNAVEQGNASERDEADGRCHAQVHVAGQQRQNPPGYGKRNTGKDDKRLPHPTKNDEQEREDGGKRDGNDQLQASSARFQAS